MTEHPAEPDGARLLLTPRLPEHPLRRHLTALSAFAAGIVPHAVVGQPDLNDARAVVDDMLLAIAKFDRLMEAYGDYAAMHWPGIDKKLFKDQALKAFEGHALYEIISAAEQAEEDMRESAAEHPGTVGARLREGAL